MTSLDISDIARQLVPHAESICRQYLFNGRREGRYWRVGDVHNTPGRSMFVRLTGPDSGKGAAGRWMDAATGEFGDLIDIIRESAGLIEFRDVINEARRFLALPAPASVPKPANSSTRQGSAQSGTREAAQRLLKLTRPIAGTLVEIYLRHRAIPTLHGTAALRFHPACYYRPDENSPTETWPAMIATVTSLDGAVTGAHRTWLARDGHGKAPFDEPKRAMGDLLGHAVRFDQAHDVLAAGEGIETVLSLRTVLPHMPMAAGLSAAHLSAILFPATMRRLYIVKDNDPAGEQAQACLTERARAIGIDPVVLTPVTDDFNLDLRRFGTAALWAILRPQIVPEDIPRFFAGTD